MRDIAGHKIRLVAVENRLHPLTHPRFEEVIRNQRNHLVAFVAPRQCLKGTQAQRARGGDAAKHVRRTQDALRRIAAAAHEDRGAATPKCRASSARARRPASRSRAFTIASRKPLGGMAWADAGLSW